MGLLPSILTIIYCLGFGYIIGVFRDDDDPGWGWRLTIATLWPLFLLGSAV